MKVQLNALLAMQGILLVRDQLHQYVYTYHKEAQILTKRCLGTDSVIAYVQYDTYWCMLC